MAPPPRAASFLLLIPLLLAVIAGGMDILSKSRLESCALDSQENGAGGGRLSCDRKIVVDVAVSGESSGGEARLEVNGVEDKNSSSNGTEAELTRIRDPPVVTISKTATYALYELNYLKDVSFKPDERYVRTRKCEPDAGADVVKECERLRDANGNVIEQTEPICCPCGAHRMPSSCGNTVDRVFSGKANTAHCLRFTGDWFHVFAIGTRSIGFSIRVQVKKGSSISEVVVSPENKTAISGDNFLRVKLVGDYASYTSIQSFEDHYLVTPRKVSGSGQPQDLGDEYSKWMVLERVRFTEDVLECDKIGVGYEAYRNQPNFCSAPFWSCLRNQLWNFWESDQSRIKNREQPQYVLEGRFQRINQHPNAGVHTFSVGVTEDLNTNLLVELRADDIEYVYQRSPAEIIDVQVQPFEALSQVGTAKVTTKNIGKLESSFSLAFHCLSGISPVEEQSYVMKPDEVIVRSFELRSSTDQAGLHRCEAILKASDFREIDRADCGISTSATVYNNGTQIGSQNDHKKGGFWDSIKAIWRALIDFITGRICWKKCSSFLNFSCHFRYICLGWAVLMVVLLAIVLAAAVLLWFLPQKGFLDYRPRHKKRHRRHRHRHRHGDDDHNQHGHHQRRRQPHAPAGDAEVEGHGRHERHAGHGHRDRDRDRHHTLPLRRCRAATDQAHRACRPSIAGERSTQCR